MANHDLNTGHSIHECSLLLGGYVIGKKLLDAHESVEISKGDNAMNDDSTQKTLSSLYRLSK